MNKLRVFYSPTPSNRIIVAKLQTLEKLKSCEFTPLVEEEARRRRQLRNIRGRAAYLWGDGNNHHESYDFTIQGRMKLKINVDHHTDDSEARSELDCGNHMAWSRRNGKRILISERMLGTTNHLEKMMERAKKVGLDYFEDEIALTIDLDGITGMPVLPKWLAHIETIDYKEVVDLIRTLDCRIFRLDIGGLIDELPDFELMQIPEGTKLSREDLLPFYLEVFPETGLGAVLPKEQLFSIVGSYVVQVYAEILETFLHIHESVLGIKRETACVK